MIIFGYAVNLLFFPDIYHVTPPIFLVIVVGVGNV
jgi:hypothetical protein